MLQVHGSADGAVRRLSVLDQLAQIPGGHLVGLAAAVDVEQARIRQQLHGRRASVRVTTSPFSHRVLSFESLSPIWAARVQNGFEERRRDKRLRDPVLFEKADQGLRVVDNVVGDDNRGSPAEQRPHHLPDKEDVAPHPVAWGIVADTEAPQVREDRRPVRVGYPFGFPVVPEEYETKARLSWSISGLLSPAGTSSSPSSQPLV